MIVSLVGVFRVTFFGDKRWHTGSGIEGTLFVRQYRVREMMKQLTGIG